MLTENTSPDLELSLRLIKLLKETDKIITKGKITREKYYEINYNNILLETLANIIKEKVKECIIGISNNFNLKNQNLNQAKKDLYKLGKLVEIEVLPRNIFRKNLNKRLELFSNREYLGIKKEKIIEIYESVFKLINNLTEGSIVN